MSRKVPRSFLANAKKNKNDEFYTQLKDIESELKHYSTQFQGKVVYCNCDDPLRSNFVKYFIDNFATLGLKKLIVTGYRENGIKPGALFEYNDSTDSGVLFEHEGSEHGTFYEYNGKESEKRQLAAGHVQHLKGDGDFRSSECVALLDEADIIVTNPPFSLFREHVSQAVEHGKKFLTIGNINAITYKDIFKLIQQDEAWLGVNLGRGISGFIVPEHYDLYGTEAQLDDSGNRIISPNNCLWLTNIDLEKRHEELKLTKIYKGNESYYPKYDNYEGINVNKTKDIPTDYMGHMGVPITFLHKYNPDQFTVIKFRKGDDDKDLSVNGKCPYFRILIRRNLGFTE